MTALMWSSVVEDLGDRLIPAAVRACLAKRRIAANAKEGATRERMRAFGTLVPTAMRDSAGHSRCSHNRKAASLV